MNDTLMDALRDLIGADAVSDITAAFTATQWAEDEIEQAMRRHPRHADRLWHSFSLLSPPEVPAACRREEPMRAHFRELLERVAAGADTRPATALECLPSMCETSLIAPMNPTGFTLYMRLLKLAGMPDLGPEVTEQIEHHEKLYADAADVAERQIRAKLSRPQRRLPRHIEHVAMCPATQNGEARLPIAVEHSEPSSPTQHAAPEAARTWTRQALW